MELRLPNSSLVQVGGRQERFFCRVPVPGNHRDGTQNGVNPMDQLESPIACIQADDPRADVVEPQRQFQQRAGKRGIMHVGRGDQEVDR